MNRAPLLWATVVAGLALLTWSLFSRPTPPLPPKPWLPRGWSVDHATAPEFLRPREILLLPAEQAATSRRLLAAGLRSKARSTSAAFDQLLKDLADESAPRSYRELVALVLGTLEDPRAQAALLQALQTSRNDGWTVLLIHALGASKNSGEDDEIFDLPDSPFVYELSGLRLEIRTRLDSAALRIAAFGFLDHENTDVRRAAARVLIHSGDLPDVRDRFADLMKREGDDGLRSGYAFAIATWAAGQPSTSPERTDAVGLLLDYGLGRDDEAVRFRSEAPLGSSALTPAEVERLAVAALTPPVECQMWSLSILSRQAAAHPELVEGACRRAAAPSSSDKIREVAARTLGALRTPSSEATLVSLLADPAWNVRLATVGSLKGRLGARTALSQAASADADSRVRVAARAALSP